MPVYRVVGKCQSVPVYHVVGQYLYPCMMVGKCRLVLRYHGR